MTTAAAQEASPLPSLTGMRFVAAFLVFVCHACVLGYFHPDVASSLQTYAFTSGWLGVEFFFVLSGFVLTWSFFEGESRTRMWRRRLVKVYPNHVVTWFAALALAIWAGQSVDLVKALPSLLLVHTWLPRADLILSINVVTWSLACDLLFYLAFPFLYGLVRRIPAQRLWTAVAAVVAVIAVLPAVALAVLPGTPALPGQEMSLTQNWFLVSFPPTRALDFVLGILMARIVVTGRWIRLGWGPALLILVAAFGLQMYLWPTVYGLTAPVALPLALLIAAVAVADLKGRFSPFRSRPLIWLGTISYASYLVHFLVLSYSHTALGADRTWDTPSALFLVTALFGVTTLLAWLLTRFVEEPAMRAWAGARAVRPGPAPLPEARSPEPTT
ncbi:acyltransferase [Microbispora triticiradicis]|uniref:Acyltransferase n=2 Tax=Microbispora triticiradicis TaxID=2200763 RepID=A0ABX9LE29_9ACTN|nr:acyltransferase [Microbispora triticiradicis]RGA01439.1 acyltransferase [Microbispora triticiradicis]GLW24920.1 acyltransferase [Microbispora amethystogenes]